MNGIMVGLLVLAALVALLGWVYSLLSGRNFPRDLATRLRLATRSLADWDRAWADNPRRSDAVVCLTSIPARLSRLEPTLKSLLAQDTAPAAIRIHLPDFSLREQRHYEVPDWLLSLRAVRVVRGTDHGPATKLIPALADGPPDQALIVVDDDMIYPPTLVADLTRHARAHPDAAIASSGWVVPADLTDRPSTWKGHLLKLPPNPVISTLVREPFPVDVLQGFSGYLVRPRFFDLPRVLDYGQAPKAAFYVDDVWLSAHCRVPKLVCRSRRYCFDRFADYGFLKRNSLGLINRGGGDPAQRNNTIMIRHFAGRWLGAPFDAPGASAEAPAGAPPP